MKNEAHARIKINQLLSEAGWRFFDSPKGPANILLENFVKISQHDIDEWGNDYEKIKGGSLDFLLLDSNHKPLCVLEAKLFVIGYPQNTENFYPIWKSGTIASEPNLMPLGIPFFYIDATTRKGMSGSPVVFRDNKISDPKGGISF